MSQAPGEPEIDLLDTPQAGPAAIRGSILRAAGYTVGTLATVLSAGLLIRHLGVDDYGRYITVLSLVATVAGLTDAGLTNIGIREYAQRSGTDRERLMRNLLGVRVTLTTLGLGLACAFAAGVGYASTLVLGTLLAGVGLLLTVLQGTFAIPLAAGLRLGWMTGMDLLRQLLTVVGIIALVLAGAGLVPFLAVTIPIGAIVLAATIALVRGAMPFRPRFDRHESWMLIKAVLPFSAAVVIGTLYVRASIILMSLIASAAQTGYFATSYRILEVLGVLPALVVSATFPVLARAASDDHARLRYSLQRVYEVTLIAGTWIGISIAVGAPFAIHVLAGNESDPSIPVLQIQAIATAATFVATGWQFGLLSLHQHRALLVTSGSAFVVSVGTALVLIPTMEAQGAAVAATVGELVVTFGSLALLLRARPDLRFSLSTTLRVALAAAAALGVLLVPVSSLLRGLAATVVYFGVLAALRAIPPEIKEALLRR